MYGVLAEMVMALHLAYVSFVVLGQAAILVGWACGWSWVRNLWFRLIHLGMIGVVAIEVFLSYECPLTVLEGLLRYEDAGYTRGDTFLARLMETFLFSIDAAIYPYLILGFALLVVVTFIFAPPRWRRLAGPATNGHPILPGQ